MASAVAIIIAILAIGVMIFKAEAKAEEKLEAHELKEGQDFLKGSQQADIVNNEGLGSVDGLTDGTKARWGSS
ncbi:hypothetical protein BJ878DRAFT_546387 [Calycina marina]|uniref:Uncharacterized protein n=1 Tax=Calycina marina TaxID=1763456 RepID=A0A9P7YV29_9HELO|nr:hypothetical protein BJ878DRAFT_546387 [Calycina marina]